MRTSEEDRDLMLAEFEEAKKKMSKKELENIEAFFTGLDQRSIREVRTEIREKLKEINE